MENSICDLKYHTGLYTGDSVRIVQDNMICAGNEEHDSCQVGPCPPPQLPPREPLLTTLFPRVTPEGPWSARSMAPGCRQVWSAGAMAVPYPTGPASTPVSPTTWTGSIGTFPRSPEPVPGAATWGLEKPAPSRPHTTASCPGVNLPHLLSPALSPPFSERALILIKEHGEDTLWP